MTIRDGLWHKDAAFYELHVRAFKDGNDDGIGDFAGLTSQLDYFKELGVDCLWLLPFFKSPLRDDGYDVSDYRAIHPDYGTMADFEKFLEAANKLGGGFDVVLDNVGRGHSLLEAISACRNGGTVVAMGYVDPRLEVPSYEIVIKEKRVLGSRAITRSGFREVVELVNAGTLDPDIGELIPIARVNEAMDNLKAGRYLARSVLMLPF